MEITVRSNESRCLLANGCKVAGTAQCTVDCQHFIAVHGRSGNGGRVAAAGVPRDYRLLTLANSPARAEQAEVYRAIEAYVATFDRQFDADGKRIKSMYFYSESPGTGKTTTASVVLNEWIRRHYKGVLERGQQPLQQPAVFIDFNAFQTDYNLATMTNDEAGINAIKATIKRAQQAPFAVLDDVGIRSASEAFKSYAHAIINHRAASGMPTVFTSNLPIEEMAKVFDARLYDRMRDQCAVLFFEGSSRRGKR